MKSLHQLHLSVLVNLGQNCSIDIARDIETLNTRFEAEGDSFLTITLPVLAKALEKGLANGYWPEHVTNFKRVGNGKLPAFMQGFLLRIFSRDGSLLEEPDVDCIRAVRQMCYLTQKVERACSDRRVTDAFAQFEVTDGQLTGLPSRIEKVRLATFVKVAHELFGEVFQECDRKIASFELLPKHGPGAVADKLSQADRRSLPYWTERLEGVFPRWRYSANLPSWGGPVPVTINDERPVRVVAVPKTQKTPRIIAIEPSSSQYAQQGLKREFYELIARDSLLNRILGFQDQSRNQSMAQKASIDERLGTLDLSEASDRVHNFLVRSMLARYPHLDEFVQATRSLTAELPNGVIPLQKFASMGSALTFPIEAMVFTTLAFCGMRVREPKLKKQVLPGILSVYGDDIIAPVDMIADVIDWLEHFGAKVNQSKSFWTGRFRESCGSEFYAGTDVSIVRLRKELPSSRQDAAEFASLVDFRNRLYLSGLWDVVSELDSSIQSIARVPYRVALSQGDRGYLYLLSFCGNSHSTSRWNDKLHHEEVRVPILKGKSLTYLKDEEPGLLEWFHDALHRGDLVDRFASQERAVAFSINYRWIADYL